MSYKRDNEIDEISATAQDQYELWIYLRHEFSERYANYE